jgi:hypothetical protein
LDFGVGACAVCAKPASGAAQARHSARNVVESRIGRFRVERA